MNIQNIVITLLVLLIPLLLLAIAVKGLKWFIDRTRVFPLADSGLREAGHSVRIRLREREVNLVVCVVMLPLLPVLLYLAYLLSQIPHDIQTTPPMALLIIYAVLLVVQVIFTLRLLFEVGRLKLALNAEIIVGQQLNQLMRLGYRVYHDVQINQVTVHHIVLSEMGIFAVETLPHPKPLRQGESLFRFRYESDALIFPNGKDKKSLLAAQRKAGVTMLWLNKTLNLPIKVRPLLLVPGWYLEVKERPPFNVLTPKQINTFFTRLTKPAFDEFQVEKIALQIEQASTWNGQNLKS